MEDYMNGTASAKRPTFQRIKRSPRLRERIRDRLEHYMSLPLALASLLMVLLSLVQLTSPMSGNEGYIVRTSILVLWAIFLAHLLVQLLLAPDRGAFLRHHWWLVITSAIPFLSFLRIAVLLRFPPMLRLVLLGGRHSSTAVRLLRSRRIGQLAPVSGFVVLIWTVLIYLVEAPTAHGNITTLSEAL
jgi:voltage-gated potassium channel